MLILYHLITFYVIKLQNQIFNKLQLLKCHIKTYIIGLKKIDCFHTIWLQSKILYTTYKVHYVSYSTLYLPYTFQLSLNLRYTKGVVFFSNVVYTEAQKVYTQIMICAWAYPACQFFAQTIISS